MTSISGYPKFRLQHMSAQGRKQRGRQRPRREAPKSRRRQPVPAKARVSGQGKSAAEHARRSARPISRRRLWLFRIVAAVGVPVACLLVLEVGLRLAGYGFRPQVTVNCKVREVPHHGDNVAFGRRFFPRALVREFEPFVFPAEKSAPTCRIFVLGASAAQGVPNHAYRLASRWWVDWRSLSSSRSTSRRSYIPTWTRSTIG